MESLSTTVLGSEFHTEDRRILWSPDLFYQVRTSVVWKMWIFCTSATDSDLCVSHVALSQHLLSFFCLALYSNSLDAVRVLFGDDHNAVIIICNVEILRHIGLQTVLESRHSPACLSNIISTIFRWHWLSLKVFHLLSAFLYVIFRSIRLCTFFATRE